jgi:oligopeptide/dipeptide ABC transporter ATP-binding protein
MLNSIERPTRIAPSLVATRNEVHGSARCTSTSVNANTTPTITTSFIRSGLSIIPPPLTEFPALINQYGGGAEPKHPDTQALQKSIPALQEKGETLYTIPGSPPDLSKPIPGCPFAPRCEFAQEKCITSTIALKEVAPDHSSACLRIQLNEINLTLAHLPEKALARKINC